MRQPSEPPQPEPDPRCGARHQEPTRAREKVITVVAVVVLAVCLTFLVSRACGWI